jgi:hypothetical protein
MQILLMDGLLEGIQGELSQRYQSGTASQLILFIFGITFPNQQIVDVDVVAGLILDPDFPEIASVFALFVPDSLEDYFLFIDLAPQEIPGEQSLGSLGSPDLWGIDTVKPDFFAVGPASQAQVDIHGAGVAMYTLRTMAL